MTRQEANIKIIGAIAKAVAENPDLRFHQLLQDIGAEAPYRDQFYEESEETLNGICDEYK